MRNLHLLAAALVASAAAAPAFAAQYSQLFEFGDSLVDAGNLQAALLAAGQPSPTPAAAGYYQGRFTNGFTAADYVSQALTGAPAQASLLGGTDYAFGGALATTNGDAIPDLGAQVGLYAFVSGGTADPNALYLINAGGNDAFARIFGAPGAPTAQAVANAIASNVATLAALGARSILVDNVGDVGATPLAQGGGVGAAGTAFSRAIDRALHVALQALVLPAGTRLFEFNAIALGDRIVADPSAFGLPPQNRTLPCIFAGASPACIGFTFFDTVHPTTAIDEVFARGILATVPEPAALALFGLGALGLAARRRVRG